MVVVVVRVVVVVAAGAPEVAPSSPPLVAGVVDVVCEDTAVVDDGELAAALEPLAPKTGVADDVVEAEVVAVPANGFRVVELAAARGAVLEWAAPGAAVVDVVVVAPAGTGAASAASVALDL